MSRESLLPEGFGDSAFSVREARERGVPASRLRASDLEAPFHGIRRVKKTVAAAEPSRDDAVSRLRALQADCAAYTLRQGRPVIFSHVTAARLHGMALPWRFESRPLLDVAAFEPDHAPQGAGILGHRFARDRFPVALASGFPVPPVLEVWVQLAADLPEHELVAAGDSLVRRKSPLTSLDELRAIAENTRQVRGVRTLRAAALDVRAGTDSPAESRMRLILVEGGLPEPVIGFEVIDRDGYFVGTPDLAYLEERIALDYEGDVHRVNRRVFRDDIERREQFQDAGWRHIRVTIDHLAKPHTLIDRVGFAIAERRLQLGLPALPPFRPRRRTHRPTPPPVPR